MNHLVVQGMSGVGKTALGRWLHEHAGVLWLEADQTPRDGLEIAGLKERWDAFVSGDATGLVDELDRRVRAKGKRFCAITLPSTCFVSGAVRIVAVDLVDAPERCRERFFRRVPEMDRAAAERHWAAHNDPGRAAGVRVVQVSRDGQLRSLAQIAAEVEHLRAG